MPSGATTATAPGRTPATPARAPCRRTPTSSPRSSPSNGVPFPPASASRTSSGRRSRTPRSSSARSSDPAHGVSRVRGRAPSSPWRCHEAPRVLSRTARSHATARCPHPTTPKSCRSDRARWLHRLRRRPWPAPALWGHSPRRSPRPNPPTALERRHPAAAPRRRGRASAESPAQTAPRRRHPSGLPHRRAPAAITCAPEARTTRARSPRGWPSQRSHRR
mmetsp:Transcript_58189/g.168577  ORF Transcript_58189/g.168577 Transcript_58189/m.168577 type:complete len:220 (+) Transcript_58189:2135-2794(+)